MRSTIRCGDCSMYLTLLVSPDSAGRCLGCARVVSLPGVLSFWSKYPNFYSYVQINRILIWNLVRQRWKVARTLREYEVGSSIPGALSFFFFWCSVFFHLFFLGTVWGFTTGYPDLIDDYTAVRCCTTYEYVFGNTYVFLLLLLLLCVLIRMCLLPLQCCCCSSSCAGWQNLFLWLLHLTPFFLSLIQRRCIFNVPLDSTVACIASIYLYDNTDHTSSVITGMRGAKAGVSPPRRSPPCLLLPLLSPSNNVLYIQVPVRHESNILEFRSRSLSSSCFF